MSTITNLVEAGTLKAVTLGLLDDELPDRGLFGTARLFNFLETALPNIQSQDPQLSAEEQVAVLFGNYLTNRPFVLKSPISPLRHLLNCDSIWELKTLDVRIFGWFAVRDTMILDSGCDVKLLKSETVNYNGFINQTTYVRKSLGFTASEYVSGDQPHDVLSNFTLLPKPQRGPLRRSR